MIFGDISERSDDDFDETAGNKAKTVKRGSKS